MIFVLQYLAQTVLSTETGGYMKFSIIMPAYNSEKYIAETLDCLLSQNEKDIEIVVVNDGSTDSTQQIVESYAEKFPQIVLVNQENAGVSAARNNGIEKANGEYIIFIDSDDLISNDSLKWLYPALKSTDADIAIFRVKSFGVGKGEFNPVVDSLVKCSEISCYDKRLIRNFIVSNKAYRADMLKNSGIRFPSMKYSEDGAFFMNIVHTLKPKITGVADALFMYRRHEGSVTHKMNSALISDFSKSMDFIYSLAENSFEDAPELKEDYLQEILFKDYSALMNEFYRMLWKAEDDDALALIGRRCEMLIPKMSNATKTKCASLINDIGTPLFSMEGIAENPRISVVVKKPTEKFMQSLYSQSMPIFEIVEKSEKPKSAVVLSFSGNEVLDPRLFKVVLLLRKIPFVALLPGSLLKLAAGFIIKNKK